VGTELSSASVIAIVGENDTVVDVESVERVVAAAGDGPAGSTVVEAVVGASVTDMVGAEVGAEVSTEVGTGVGTEVTATV